MTAGQINTVSHEDRPVSTNTFLRYLHICYDLIKPRRHGAVKLDETSCRLLNEAIQCKLEIIKFSYRNLIIVISTFKIIVFT